jgi:hypothetical protein
MTNNEIQLLEARPDDAAIREAVLAITRAAFLVNPMTGQRIEGDTPSELPMTMRYAHLSPEVNIAAVATLDAADVGEKVTAT